MSARPSTGGRVSRSSAGRHTRREARIWTGNIELVADLSSKLHLCQTKYSRFAITLPKNGFFQRYSHKLQTWEGAASVDLGMGVLQLRAWSGASKSVGYDYTFGVVYDQHWLCGTDAYPPDSSRIFAGG